VEFFDNFGITNLKFKGLVSQLLKYLQLLRIIVLKIDITKI